MHNVLEWQAAMETLILDIERGGPRPHRHRVCIEPLARSRVQPERERTLLGSAQTYEGSMTVWIYDQGENLKVFASDRSEEEAK